MAQATSLPSAFLIFALLLFCSHAVAQSTAVSSTLTSTSSSPSLSASKASSCLNFASYFDQEAWASYGIPGVAAGYRDDPSRNWTVTATVASESSEDQSGQYVERSLYLDTSSTLDDQLSQPPLGLCAITLDLPASDNNKVDPGDCSVIFSKDCVKDLTSQFSSLSVTVASGPGLHVDKVDPCSTFISIINTPPKSCNAFVDKETKQLGGGQFSSECMFFSLLSFILTKNVGPPARRLLDGTTKAYEDSQKAHYQLDHNLSSHSDLSNCNSTRHLSAPRSLFNLDDRIFSPNATTSADAIINHEAGITQALILAIFSNSTLSSQSTFGSSRLVCARPANNSSGIISTSKAGGAGVVTVGTTSSGWLASVALALNAVLFFLFL